MKKWYIVDQRIDALEQKLQVICLQRKDCQRLLTIFGIGLLTATAMVAAVSDIAAFKDVRIAWALLSKKEEYNAAACLAWVY